MLVASQSFANERLYIGRELCVKSPHTVLHQAAESLDHTIFIYKLSKEAIDEGP